MPPGLTQILHIHLHYLYGIIMCLTDDKTRKLSNLPKVSKRRRGKAGILTSSLTLTFEVFPKILTLTYICSVIEE